MSQKPCQSHKSRTKQTDINKVIFLFNKISLYKAISFFEKSQTSFILLIKRFGDFNETGKSQTSFILLIKRFGDFNETGPTCYSTIFL